MMSPVGPSYKLKYSIVACARWEADDIVEWIEYHRAIGFDHIFLYSNDDDPGVLRSRIEPYLYGKSPFVTYLHWPFEGQQFQIYMDFFRRNKDTTEWITFLDIDEFYTFPKCDSVHRFMEDFEDKYDCVYFNWLIFGNNGRITRDPSLHVLQNYVRRSRYINIHTKNLVRTKLIDREPVAAKFTSAGVLAFWHFWDQYRIPSMRMTNVLQESVAEYSANFPHNALRFVGRDRFTEDCLSRGYISHFQLKSEGDFQRRYQRGGFANTEFWQKTYDEGTYKTMLADLNQVEDVYLARFWTEYVGNGRNEAAYSPVGRPNLENVALGRPTSQVSVYVPNGPEPSHSHARDHGNDGFRSGAYGFHTQLEDNPWWMVDLLHVYHVSEIHIYNRADGRLCAQRSETLTVECSDDRSGWVTVYEPCSANLVNGILPVPLIIHLPAGTKARFIRLSLRSRNFLHLDEVEVYGVIDNPLPPSHAPRSL